MRQVNASSMADKQAQRDSLQTPAYIIGHVSSKSLTWNPLVPFSTVRASAPILAIF